jgi:hypothetical protein
MAKISTLILVSMLICLQMICGKNMKTKDDVSVNGDKFVKALKSETSDLWKKMAAGNKAVKLDDVFAYVKKIGGVGEEKVTKGVIAAYSDNSKDINEKEWESLYPVVVLGKLIQDAKK